MNNSELHVLSTGRHEPEELAEIISSIQPYIKAFHIREKRKTAIDIYNTVKLLNDKNVPLSKIIINDRIDVAHATGVGGVQLAYHSLPIPVVKKQFASLKVGCSVHSLREAKAAEEQGADYVIFGHIFPTQSKPGLKPRGIEQLEALIQAVSIPVHAIGGIKPSNVREVIRAGASGIAVMSGVLEANNPLHAVKEYRLAIEQVNA